jgi:hypothetical protein
MFGLEHDSDRCLTIKRDEEKQTTFPAFLFRGRLPDWNALHQTPTTIRTVVVHGNNQETMTVEVAYQIALAIENSSGRIKVIRFVCCCITDLLQLFDDAITRIINPADRRVSFHFHRCRLDNDVANLQLMLQYDMVEHLHFTECEFNDGTTFAEAIRANRSLKTFECYAGSYTFPPFVPVLTMSGVYDMLKSNRNLVKLGLTVQTDDNSCLWDVFCSAKDSQTLQSLEIGNSNHLNLKTVKAILLMCFTINSLQELTFRTGSFQQDAVECLIETLANSKLISTLTLDDFWLCDANFGNVKVEKLKLTGLALRETSLSDMITSAANNSCIQSLHLDSSKHTLELVFQDVCDVFLRPNRGPSQLTIGSYYFRATAAMTATLTTALQQNTSVKALNIASIRGSELVVFSQGLANMSGLHSLSMKFFRDENDDDGSEEQILEALQESLEQNTTLCKLSIDGVESTRHNQRYLSRIGYLLATNLVGRHVLMIALNVPAGLWARVLARSSKEADGIYFALTEKPDIIISEPRRS